MRLGIITAAARRRRSRGISQEARVYLILRDQQRCRYCGKELDPFARPNMPNAMTIDHIVPLSSGGTNQRLNLVLACHPCNARKENRLPSEAGMRLLPEPSKIHRLSP